MWEQAMSTTKVKRSWSILSRSTFNQAPTSPAFDTEPATASQQSTSTAQQKESSAVDMILLHDVRKVLREAEQLLHIIEAPLSDARVVTKRKEVEKVMPRLYAIIEEQTSSHASSEARRVKDIAEGFLRKFPDVDVDALRSSVASEIETRVPPSPGSASQSGTPPRPRDVSVSPRQEPPAVSAKRPPRIESELSIDRESRLVPGHLREAIMMVTPSQKLVMLAVHDLLSTTAGVVKNVSQAWFNPPAARSPDELYVAHTANSDRRPFVHTHHPMHAPSSLPPNLPTPHNMRLYPQVGTYEHTTGTYTHQRSASNDSSL